MQRDLAALRAAYLLVDTASYDELKNRIEPLTADNRTFRHSARSLLALAAWRANNAAEMRRWTDMVLADPQTPSNTRGQVEMLIALAGAGRQELSCDDAAPLPVCRCLLLAAGLALAGCETFDLESIWSSKKPLPGERRAVFPQGVPGVQQGVPPDLVRGYQPPAGAAAGGRPQPEKPKPAPRASRRRRARLRRRVSAAPQTPRQQQQVQEEPPQHRPLRRRGPHSRSNLAAAWPDPPSRTAQPQQSAPAWPDPPRPGTATR